VIGFAVVRRTYAKAFERYALELSKNMTILDVAEHLGVGWDLVKEIQKRYLSKKYRCTSLDNIEKIAIDEICIGKGHRYLTVVLNLTSGAVIFVGEGKSADALIPFWKRVKRAKKEIKAVAIEMSPSYISAVINNLSKTKIVFDHFHMIEFYNDKLRDLRRNLHREAEGPLQISTGPLEGTNNKIKTLQRRSYGFRDLGFFKLKIFALHVRFSRMNQKFLFSDSLLGSLSEAYRQITFQGVRTLRHYGRKIEVPAFIIRFTNHLFISRGFDGVRRR